MSSYLSSILTNTTERYNTLRQNLISNEADGDTEDDSHISRVLRAYYVEKGQGMPQWLPPDPKQRSLSIQSATSFTSSLRGSTNQNMQPAPPQQRGSLSDLWDTPSQSAPPQQSMSLRRQAADRSGSSFQGRPQETFQPQQQQQQARPVPSIRVGSQQNPQYQQAEPTTPGTGTAQDRLKARLWGAARSSSTVSQSGDTQYGNAGGNRLGAPSGSRPR